MRHNISDCHHEEDIMSSTEVILVGVDGSTESLAAVKWAADRGARTGARIHCLCTYALASYSAAALDGGYAVLDDEALKAGGKGPGSRTRSDACLGFDRARRPGGGAHRLLR